MEQTIEVVRELPPEELFRVLRVMRLESEGYHIVKAWQDASGKWFGRFETAHIVH